VPLNPTAYKHTEVTSINLGAPHFPSAAQISPTLKKKRHFNTIKGLQALQVCDDGTLVKILCFWTLSIVLSLSKT
jgi:hypothetical protein